METQKKISRNRTYWQRPDIELARSLLDEWAAAKQARVTGMEPSEAAKAEKTVDAFLAHLSRPLLGIGLLYRLYPRGLSWSAPRGCSGFIPERLFGDVDSGAIARTRAALNRALHRELVDRLAAFTQKCS